MSVFKCRWCGLEVFKIKYSFCCKLHMKYYDNFRAGFKAEIFELKTKPKVSDTEKYKMIRKQLMSEY